MSISYLELLNTVYRLIIIINASGRVSRLCEESGELASAVNHLEGMGVKRRKHGQLQYDNLIKEIQDVMRCAVGIAVHYGVEREVVAAIARSAEGVERK